MKLGGILALSAALVLTACAPTPPPVSDKVQAYYDENAGKIGTASPTAKPITFAAIGDSITEGNSRNFIAGDIGDGSWAFYAQKAGLKFAGGWADGGAPTSTMRDHASAISADVLVIIAGTNDSAQGVPFEETTANLKKIADTVGAKRVIVSAIPPRDAKPQVAAAFNAELMPFVQAQGWEFVDATAGLRQGDAYAPGLTVDGVHPTAQGAKIIGEAIAKAITKS